MVIAPNNRNFCLVVQPAGIRGHSLMAVSRGNQICVKKQCKCIPELDPLGSRPTSSKLYASQISELLDQLSMHLL